MTTRYLLEDIATIREQYPNIDNNTFIKLINLDPTYVSGSNHIGKYGKQLIEDYSKGILIEGDFNRIFSRLTKLEEDLTETLHTDIPDILETDSDTDVANLLLNKPKVYRILYDKRIDKYFIDETNKYIHREILEKAVDNGYYVSQEEFKNFLGDWANYFDYGIDSVASIADWSDDEAAKLKQFKVKDNEPWLFCLVFVPNNLENEAEYNYSSGEDGYDYYYKIETGIIYTRGFLLENEFPGLVRKFDNKESSMKIGVLKEDITKEIKINDNDNIIEDEKELKPPVELSYMPNNMGINLCSVKKEKWVEQDDGQLKKVEIEFEPLSKDDPEYEEYINAADALKRAFKDEDETDNK